MPYVNDTDLGLTAGNRFSVKIVNSAITSKAQLPSGNIATTIGAEHTNHYTKAAFEDDGSLILVCNASKTVNTVVKIKWVSGVETTYTFDFSGATFAAE